MFKYSAQADKFHNTQNDEVLGNQCLCARCGELFDFDGMQDSFGSSYFFTIQVPRAKHKEWTTNVNGYHPTHYFPFDDWLCKQCFKAVLPAALKAFDVSCLNYTAYFLEKAIKWKTTKNQVEKSKLRASLEQCLLTPPKVFSTEIWTWIELWPSTN